MKLTQENVDYIFKECVWPFEEWKDLHLSIDEAPEAAQLLLSLPSGINVCSFHPKKLRKYKQEIGELLDQIPILSEKTGVSFPMLAHTVDQEVWTNNPYEIQKLYLLGVVTDQLISIPVHGTISIGRIPEEKAVVTLVSQDQEGKKKIIGKRYGKDYFIN